MDRTERDYLNRRINSMKNERASFEAHWKELAEYVQPRRGRFFTGERNEGKKKHQSIINSKATQALRVARAGMLAGTMSPTRPWFVLEPMDRDLMESKAVKIWLSDQEKLLRSILNAGNFYNMAPVMLGELLLFGTGCMLHMDDYDDVARFYTQTVGSYMVAQNDRHVVDTLGREFELTTTQMIKSYGIENVSSSVRDEYDKGNYDTWFVVRQLIEPNPDARTDSGLAKNLPYRSLHWEQGRGRTLNRPAEDEKLLSRSGYHEFPAYVPRWDLTGEDVYGTDCPGMTSLGDIKGLQLEEKRKAQGIDKMVNPPLHGPASLRNVPVSSLPGGLTIYDAGQTQGLRPIYEVQPRLQEMMMDIEKVERRIDEAFYVDMFMAISNMEGIQPRNQLDLSQRNEERLLQLGPVLERVHGEFLEKLIDRLFAQCVRADIISPPPPELSEQHLDVRFISSLAQAQRSVVTGVVERFGTFVGQVAQMKPEILDKFNADEAANEYAEAIGVPPKVVMSDDEVMATRQQRAQQQQQMMMLQMAQQAAETGKTISETDVSEGSLAGKLDAAMGGEAPQDE